MVDVLVLAGGELVHQSDPTEWWRVTAGEVVPESGSGNDGLQISSGERVHVAGPVLITVDCADLSVCNAGETGGTCNTLGGCVSNGEKHRIEFNTTGCSDASHHIGLRREIDGTGGFNEFSGSDDHACAPSEPDAGCCISGETCTEGKIIITELVENTTTTKDYQYQVRIELDPNDVLAQAGSFLNTNKVDNQGGDDACFE